jgi:beta-lactam-binding protein with PASTA domain
MAIRSVTVGIFDNAQDAERAAENLAAVGFDDTVYEDAAHEQGRVVSVSPAPVGNVLAPSVVSEEVTDKTEPERPNLVRAFKSRLTEYQLPDEVIEGYATTFDHGGKFILVRTHPERDEEVVKILRKCGASRVNRYDV